METWLDDHGRTLVRAGRGRVTAVVPLNAEGTVVQVSVEIEVAARPGQAKAVRVLVRGLAEIDSPIHQTAAQSLEIGGDVDWIVRWVRHSWVPEDVPIESLRLATDTTAYISELALVDADRVDADRVAKSRGELIGIDAELSALIDSERP